MAKKKTDDPADEVFRPGYRNGGTFLFDDGSIGYIADPEFDITEYYEDDDWDDYDPMETDEVPPRLYLDGKKPIGNIYIDRYTSFGSDGFQQGGCFWYYEGETYRDYCDRNGEPCPVKRIPDEIYEAFEADDLETIKGYCKQFPELKALIEDVPAPKKKPEPKKSDVNILNPRFVPIKPLSEDDYWFDDLEICPNCGSDRFRRLEGSEVRICTECGCAFVNSWKSGQRIDYDKWDHEIFNRYREAREQERSRWFKKGSNYAVFGGEAYSPENFDRMRYGALFDYDNPKDRSKILNFNFRRKKR